MKKTVILLLLVFLLVPRVFSQVDLPQPSTSTSPIWYYVQVKGSDDRKGKIFYLNGNDLYGRNFSDITATQRDYFLFRFEKNADGSYKIINKKTNKELGIRKDATKNIDVVTVAPTTTVTWSFEERLGYWKIKSSNNLFAFQSSSASNKNYVIEASTFGSNDNGSFGFILFNDTKPTISDGQEYWYYIKSAKTGIVGACITDVNETGSGAVKFKLQDKESEETKKKYQQWKVVKPANSSSGEFVFVNRATGNIIQTACNYDGYFNAGSTKDIVNTNGWDISFLELDQFKISGLDSQEIQGYLNASPLSSEAELIPNDANFLHSAFAWKFEAVSSETSESTLVEPLTEDVILSFTIDPTETLKVMKDIKVVPSGGVADSYQGGENIERSFDGDMSTLYHSSYGSTSFPVTLRYDFEASVEQIDYFIYHPRTSGSNGNFKKIEVRYKLQGGEEIKYKDFDFGGSGTASTVLFDTPLINPEYIVIKVKSGVGDSGNGFASCAEMEFYQFDKDMVDLSQFFVDDIYSALKPGVTKEQIIGDPTIPLFFKYIALQQLDGTYSSVRVLSHEAYRPYKDLAAELKTSTYNQYENPTGVFIEAGESIVVFVEDTNGENLSLVSYDWDYDRARSYSLKPGINYITPTSRGNTYINYYTKNYLTAQPVKIHVSGGKANGIFVSGQHDNEDWKNLLANASSDYLDIVGKYVNLTYYVPELKKQNPNDGVGLIELYDEIIQHQYELMGFFKYNRVPKNHMFGRNTLTGFMSAGGIGANFQYETLNAIGNPAVIVKGGNSWGIAHEFGHVNQIRPTMKWHGLAECTNNVYSSYTQYILQEKYSTFDLRLEHENCQDLISSEGGVSTIGGRFNSHLHYGVLKGENWLFQWGQDAGNDRSKVDHFVKLVPMWQLNLYYKIAKNTPWAKPDWYADICEEAIKQKDSGISNGQHQINFMKRACQYTETDLTEFFEKAGLLKPVSKTFDDYGSSTLKITEAMCQTVRDYVKEKGWKKPVGVINYISGNTVKIYEQQLPVTGTLNEGVTGTGDSRVVSHNVWKNAVVYKTYKKDEVIRLTMAGTGTKNNSSTRVPFPAGATKIVAVSWDGKETTVYELDNTSIEQPGEDPFKDIIVRVDNKRIYVEGADDYTISHVSGIRVAKDVELPVGVYLVTIQGKTKSYFVK
ncbi:M60 family metallopeptidase [Bacteroidales bacterium OttesenSCG-928-M06]|nr:M60 family metallopeptidase [Bacteroidales bacterium OttesenSCG-928-M06]